MSKVASPERIARLQALKTGVAVFFLGFFLFACTDEPEETPERRAVIPRSGDAGRPDSAAFSKESFERSWAEFLKSPPYADLHNDRSFFLTARGIPWRQCAGVQLCAATYGSSNSFFSLWRPPTPVGAGRPWGLTARQARRLNSMSHFEYLRQAIDDLKNTGISISDSAEHVGGDRPHIFLGIEGAYLLNKTGAAVPSRTELIEILNFLKKEKVSYIALVWSNDNIYAGTAGSKKGLTKKGRALVRLLIERGFLIDLSHASDKTVLDFHSFTRGRYPLFFSHSSARALCGHARNLSDELLALVKATGGLVGVNFYTKYLSCGKKADIADVAAHIAYIHHKAGPEHVALGSDFDGLISLPEGLEKPGHLTDLAILLKQRNFSQKEIEQIFYGNVRKFLSEWRATEKLDI